MPYSMGRNRRDNDGYYRLDDYRTIYDMYPSNVPLSGKRDYYGGDQKYFDSEKLQSSQYPSRSRYYHRYSPSRSRSPHRYQNSRKRRHRSRSSSRQYKRRSQHKDNLSARQPLQTIQTNSNATSHRARERGHRSRSKFTSHRDRKRGNRSRTIQRNSNGTPHRDRKRGHRSRTSRTNFNAMSHRDRDRGRRTRSSETNTNESAHSDRKRNRRSRSRRTNANGTSRLDRKRDRQSRSNQTNSKTSHRDRKRRLRSRSSKANSETSHRDKKRGHRWAVTEYPRETRVRVDAESHLIYKEGDVLHSRYEVVKSLGKGSFGQVVQCRDRKKHGRNIALKILQNIAKYREEVKHEVDVLEKIKAFDDPQGENRCVMMRDWFDYHGHMCIAFDMYDLSVYEFLKDSNFQPFPIEQVRYISYQLCQTVGFLHRNHLIHTDLKPENILFIDSAFEVIEDPVKRRRTRRLYCSDIKVIDFGSATFDDEHKHLRDIEIQTAHYRAPEVIMELGWLHPCDVWSIGCIILELYTGNTTFKPDYNREHLAMMERVLGGPFPWSLVKKSRKKYYYDRRTQELDWDPDSHDGIYVKKHCKPLRSNMREDSEEHRQLFDLIEKMLEYDPHFRINLSEAVEHPFFEMINAKEEEEGRSTCNGRSGKSIYSRTI